MNTGYTLYLFARIIRILQAHNMLRYNGDSNLAILTIKTGGEIGIPLMKHMFTLQGDQYREMIDILEEAEREAQR